jgi:hypothetical protein
VISLSHYVVKATVSCNGRQGATAVSGHSALLAIECFDFAPDEIDLLLGGIQYVGNGLLLMERGDRQFAAEKFVSVMLRSPSLHTPELMSRDNWWFRRPASKICS